jgi:hypothetical protein
MIWFGCWFIETFFPETKRVALEEMQQRLNQ